jgi:hypothetical protein
MARQTVGSPRCLALTLVVILAPIALSAQQSQQQGTKADSVLTSSGTPAPWSQIGGGTAPNQAGGTAAIKTVAPLTKSGDTGEVVTERITLTNAEVVKAKIFTPCPSGQPRAANGTCPPKK